MAECRTRIVEYSDCLHAEQFTLMVSVMFVSRLTVCGLTVTLLLFIALAQ